MKKFKSVILISIFCAIIFFIVTFWVPEIDWSFLPFLILAGFFMVWIQKETVSYKFLDKLLIGCLLFGFLMMFLVFLRMYVMSHLVYDAPLPFRELWNEDIFIIAGVYCFVSFLGGLLGIALKGFYSLYKNKLDKIIIIIGPLLILFSSLSIFKIKYGGTIMSGLYGWPYPFLINQIKDVVDGFSIDKWIFSPGSIYHYVIFDYFLYLSIFISVYYLIKFINKKFKKSVNSTFLLFGLLVLMIIFFTSYLSIKKSYIQHQISGAKYCEAESDCEIIANISPFSCAIVSNKDSADRILKLVKSYPSTGELNCSGREKAICMQNKCRISIDHTPNEMYWEMLKKSVENCDVSSIMQTHNLEVTAILKNDKVIKVKEPEIDDIFDIVTKSKDRCGEMIMGTE
ncbi:MAG: hypothetical protein ABIE43_04525 [Patescibacteria group bacterium]